MTFQHSLSGEGQSGQRCLIDLLTLSHISHYIRPMLKGRGGQHVWHVLLTSGAGILCLKTIMLQLLQSL